MQTIILWITFLLLREWIQLVCEARGDHNLEQIRRIIILSQDTGFAQMDHLPHQDNIPADLAQDGAGVQRPVGSPALRHELGRQLLGFVSKKEIL